MVNLADPESCGFYILHVVYSNKKFMHIKIVRNEKPYIL